MTTRPFLPLLLLATLARADVLPPSQDTSSLKGKLTAATGKATTLTVSTPTLRFALVQFDLSKLPAGLVAADIANARLRVYFTKVIKADDLSIGTVGAAWNETTNSPFPALAGSDLARIPAASVVSKKFAEADVTEAVRAWIDGTAPNHGFYLIGMAPNGAGNLANVLIGAKEGPGSGYPCELDVQIDRTITGGSIGATQLADGSVTNAKLAAGAAVANLVDGTVALAKLASSTFSVTAGSGLSGGGSVPLGGNVTLSLDSDLSLGGTTSGTFSGDGSGLTGLQAGSLSGGLSVAPQGSAFALGGIPESAMGVGRALQVAVAESHAYLANGGDGFRIIDISDPAQPVLKARLDFAAEGVAVVGSTAYVISLNGLYIINVSDPANPGLVGSIASSSLGVAVSGNIACLAQGILGLGIIDLTNPASPSLAGSVPQSTMGYASAEGVTISGTHAYVANGSAGLFIIDISNPAAPSVVGSVPRSAMDVAGTARRVAISGAHAYVADSNAGLSIIDISNPAAPSVVGSVPRSAMGDGSAFDVTVSGRFAYVANHVAGLQVVDISNPANPVAKGRVPESQLGSGRALGVAVAGNYTFLANWTDGFRTVSLGTASASAFAGDGSALTNLSGTSLAAGSVTASQLASGLTLGGTTRGAFFGDGSALTNLNASNIATGTLADNRLSNNLPRLDAATTVFTGSLTAASFTGDGSGLTNVWQLGGNAGTTPGTHFLGTTDNQPLEFKVNGQRALRLEYVETPALPGFDPIVSVNMIGGFRGNVVSGGVLGATIGGGGSSSVGSNGVTGDYGTVSGGTGNIAGETATVSGGSGNVASGFASMIPGGSSNLAAGAYSFAAGVRAEANHEGAFVWADYYQFGTPFASSAPNQFNVRASGGVRIFSNGAATLGVALAPNATSWSTLSDQNAKKNFAAVDVAGVLERLAAVPVQRWNYKSEPDDAVPHLGPMAQAFKAAFYPGRDDKVITTLEFDGVELAAIQGLHAKLKAKDEKIAELEKRLERLEQMLTK